jgi:hypothetical protein
MVKVERSVFFLFVFLVCVPQYLNAAMPDLGPDGMAGLSEEQKQEIALGKPVFTLTGTSPDEQSGLIEAAIVFDRSPEETWNLFYRTEDQYKYLKELEMSRVINKSQLQDKIEFRVRALFITQTFRVIHHFDKPDYYFYWGLDPDFKNDLADLRGFYRFYPYGRGRTLARYGSNVSVKNVPKFIENIFKKSGVGKSLVSVKKYIDSGGTYRK